MFPVYTHILALLLACYGADGHFCADDWQVYLPIPNIEETKTEVLALLSNIKIWIRHCKLKLNESETEIMLIKGYLRTNVTCKFDNLDVKASTLVPVNTVQNLDISFDPDLSFKKQIDTVVKNFNFRICNIYLSIYLGRFPQLGGSRQHKRNNKNNGGFTPFFQQ